MISITQPNEVFHKEQYPKTIPQSVVALVPIIEDLEVTQHYLHEGINRNSEMRCRDAVDELTKSTEHAHLREQFALAGILIATLKGCILTTNEVME